jgi:uncharacterized membrane protein YjfL (UPF0719 family)
MPESLSLLIVLNLIVTSFLLGLSVFVLLVHYPGFGLIGQTEFKDYQVRHMKFTAAITLPGMLAELGLTAALFVSAAHSDSFNKNLILAGLVLIIWGLTFLMAIPTHNRLLNEGRSHELIQKLIKIHAYRTFFWALRLILLLILW